MTERSCWACLRDVEARDGRAAGVRPQQRREDAHRGGLAGAVGAEQAEDGALGDRQVDAVEGPDLALARLVDLDQALGRDDVHAAAHPPGAVQDEGPSIRARHHEAAAGHSLRPAEARGPQRLDAGYAPPARLEHRPAARIPCPPRHSAHRDLVRLTSWLERWGGIAPLLVAEFVVWVGFGGLLPVLPLYFTEQGIDLATLGIVIAAWPAARLVSEPVFGWLADRTERVPLMVIGLVATGVFGALPLVFTGPSRSCCCGPARASGPPSTIRPRAAS